MLFFALWCPEVGWGCHLVFVRWGCWVGISCRMAVRIEWLRVSDMGETPERWQPHISHHRNTTEDSLQLCDVKHAKVSCRNRAVLG